MALTQSQQSSDDCDGELSVAPATYNSHSSQTVAVSVAFLDKAKSECDHTRHAASNTAQSCDAQAACEDPSAQDNKSVAETADLAEAGTCAQATACSVSSIRLLWRQGAGRGNAGSPSTDWRMCGTGLFVASGNCQEGALFRAGAARLLHHRSEEMVIADTLQRRDLDFLRDTLERPCNHEVPFGAAGDPVAKGESLNHGRHQLGCRRRFCHGRATIQTASKRQRRTKEDLQADVAKHSSKLTQPLDGEISALQSELGALSKTQFQMDTTRALEGNLGTTRGSLEQGISEVQKAPDTLRNCFEASVVK